MKQAVLVRTKTGDQGTQGALTFFNEDGSAIYSCVTIELPWRDNARWLSCMPAKEGVLFKWRKDSPAHGEVYEEWDDPSTPDTREDVDNRDNCQFHAANLAGDKTKGYVAQLEGCIAPGKGFALYAGGAKPAGTKDQWGVTSSGTALKEMVALLHKDTFRLSIRWAPGVLELA